MRTLRVIYSGESNPKPDNEIRGFFKSMGFRWYAQGYNFIDHERDICFDFPREEAAKGNEG